MTQKPIKIKAWSVIESNGQIGKSYINRDFNRDVYEIFTRRVDALNWVGGSKENIIRVLITPLKSKVKDKKR